MTLYLRRGARVKKLTLETIGSGIYAAKWGKRHVFFEADGEVQNVIDAAAAALGKE